MTNKRKIRKAAAGMLMAALAVLPAGGGILSVGSIPTGAVTEQELAEKIAANEAYISELDKKISDIDADIASSEQKQDYYFQKLMAQKEQIDLINGDIYAKELEIGAKQDEIDAKEQEILDKEQEIAGKESEIYAKETVIQATEGRIESKSEDIKLLENQNLDNVSRFGKILHAMYITDNDDYMSVLAGSADFYDISVRTKVLNSVGEQNVEFMHQLLDDIHKLENDKVQLGEEIKQLEKEKEALGDEKSVLEDQREALKYEKDVLGTEKSILLDDKAVLSAKRADEQAISDSFTYEYNSVSAQIANFEQKQRDYAYQQQVSREEIERWEKEREDLIRRAQLNATNSVVYDDGEWIWPLDHKFTLITTYFGYDAWRKGNHGAIDIGNSGIMGANIYASKGGEVIVAKTSYIPGYDYGMYVVIDHGNGYQTLYAHMSSVNVSVGQMVSQGQVIGLVGSTGWSTGPHLHFEMRLNGTRIDPLGLVAIP